MFGRSTFGASQPNTFGFGSGPSTSFGQPNQLFGSSNSTFGSGSSGFGSTSQPIFGNPPQSAAPLFGASAAPAFGQGNQSAGFGASLFGGSQQPSGSSGIFGSSAGTSFGQQNKPSGFGFPSSSSGGLFGQSTQTQQNAGSMFQPSSSSGLFGNSSTFGGGQAQIGTVNKFVPVTGTDTVQKAGAVQSINTKHYCITCMKDYENKSLEELRWEDYQANRKGQQSGFGAPSQPFGIASTNSALFGQIENKPAQQHLISLENRLLDSEILPRQIHSLSEAHRQPVSLEVVLDLNLLRLPQMHHCLDRHNRNRIHLGQQQGFNMGQSTFQFGATGQGPSIFQNPKPVNTGFTIFGQNNTSTAPFGQPQQQSTMTPFNSIFSKPNQSLFNQSSSSNFMGLQNSPFNNTSKSIFPSGNNIFLGGNTFQTAPLGFSLQPQQPQQQVINMHPGSDLQPIEGRPVLPSGDPYGFSPHLGSLAPVKQQGTIYATNPRELQKFLDVPQPVAVVTPTTKRIKVFPPSTKKSHLFDEGADADASEVNLTLKSSAKRLIIRKDSDTSLMRELSNTSLDISIGGERPESILPTVMSKGPPLFASPIRIRKPIEVDEYSSSGLTTKESAITLNTEKSDENGLENEIEQVLENATLSNTDILVDEPNPASGDASQQIETTKESPIDTCGITLTRPDYYTVPPMDKLYEHRLGDGQCLIRGFTIGRVGYGNVSFPDLIDIANLNLDELVHFRYRELTIYPDDTKKPPLGQGLNRRAQVTLDRVYPKEKVDRKLITDLETLTAINFADTLRDLCEKHGSKFLDYRPETGSWVFMVEHFSKYKYSDSDTEDDTDELDSQTTEKITILKKQARSSNDPEMLSTPTKISSPENEKKITLIENEQVEHPTQSLVIDDDIFADFVPPVPSSDSLHQVKTRRELYQFTGQKLLLMKATLFDDEDFEPVNIESDNIETIGTKSSQKLLKDFMKSTLAPRKVEDFHRQKPRVFTLCNKPCTLPMDKSLYNCRNYIDMGLYKGRSFKVGWGKGMTLITLSNESPGIRGRIQIVDATKASEYDSRLEILSDHIRVFLNTSSVEIVDDVPFASVRNVKVAMTAHQIIAKHSLLKESDQKKRCYHKEVWDLVSALWNDLPWDGNRREELSTWFQDVLSREIEQILPKSSEVSTDGTLEDNYGRRFYSGGSPENLHATLWDVDIRIWLRETKETEYVHEGDDILDLQYYLLLLHCDKSLPLEKVLHPLTHTNYAGDYRLSWLLLQMLTALGVGVLNEERRVMIAMSFSSQLESLGLPKWAIFPLLFIKDPIVRKNSIMRTLYRDLDSSRYDISEYELANELLIPSLWIHEVKTCKAKFLRNHWLYYQHLSCTQKWRDAHKVAIDLLIPDLIINENFDVMYNILFNLEKGQEDICDWTNQGGLLLAFLRIARECSRSKMSKEHAMTTQSALLDVITKLPFYPMEGSKQIAAVSELSKRCYIFAKILLHFINPTYKGVITVANMELDKLIMPSDYIFQGLQHDKLKG
ncbi:hypothetical protein Trydic_g18599 [Trypoxylus dichotomus]